ncbi:MAG: GPO family capsid scaffolding protein [Cycloclasticus sp.]|jgi:Phage capsid scaffolding protein (GPO) serine peptidase.
MAAKLRTRFYRVAVAGDSIDDREITEDELNELAETYNPKFYGALMWKDHIRYYGNYGQVVAVKAAKINDESDPLNGRLALYAVLSPNQYLIELNKKGQSLFTSIEIWPDFAKTGKVYLAGLGIVDQPGSVGTEPLEFKKKQDSEFIISTPQNYGLSDALNSMGDIPANAFAHNLDNPNQEDKEMNKEQFEAFMTQQSTQHEALMENIQGFINKPDGEGDKGGDEGEGSKDFVSRKDFDAVTDSLATISKSLETVTSELTTLKGEEFGTTDPDGDGDKAEEFKAF